MPQLDGRIVAPAFKPVVAVRGGERVEGDQQVRPIPGGVQPPGPVSVRRPVPAGRGEGEPRRPWPRVFPVVPGFGTCAAVPDSVAVLVGHSHAPVRLRVPRCGGGQVAGQPGIDGASPDSSPGRPARLVRVASGTVRLARPANPPGAAPTGVGWSRWGRESLFRSRSSRARARIASVPPSRPALRSSSAHQVIRSSTARISSGGSSRPARAALPESSRHRSTRANFAAVSRRSFAFSGATSMTARAMAARSAPGVSRAARSRTLASAARASASSRPVALG